MRDFRAAAPDPSDRVLSVRVTGAADGEYVCALSLEPQAKVRASDTVQHEGDLTIVVANDSTDKAARRHRRLERGPRCTAAS